MKGNVNEKECQAQKTVREAADNRCCNLFSVPPTILSAWVFQDAVALVYLSVLHCRHTVYTHFL